MDIHTQLHTADCFTWTTEMVSKNTIAVVHLGHCLDDGSLSSAAPPLTDVKCVWSK